MLIITQMLLETFVKMAQILCVPGAHKRIRIHSKPIGGISCQSLLIYFDNTKHNEMNIHLSYPQKHVSEYRMNRIHNLLTGPDKRTWIC